MKFIVKFKGKIETDGVVKASEIADHIAKKIRIHFLDECEVEFVKPIENQKLSR